MLTRRYISPEQTRVLDAALARLIEAPQLGRIDVTMTELRFALSDLPNDESRRLIDSCVPQLLWKTATSAGGGDRYAFTFNGILLVSEPKVVTILNAAMSVLRKHFNATKGSGPQLLSWTDVKSEVSGFTDDDFELARQAILASRLGVGGRRGLGDMATDPGFKFYAPGSQELEIVVECDDAWELLARRETPRAFVAAQHAEADPAADMLYEPDTEVTESEQPAPTDIYLIGQHIPGGNINWQLMRYRAEGREPLVRVSFVVSCGSSKPTRRDIMQFVAEDVARNDVGWLSPGPGKWSLDLGAMTTAFELPDHCDWLGDACIELLPEFETGDTERLPFRYSGRVVFYLTPSDVANALATQDKPLRVLVFHGPENTTKFELLAWLRGPDIGADARTVGEMPPDTEGSVDDRVDRAIKWADKAIAIVTRDDRSPSGAPNIIEEIGRWRGAGREADLAIVRQRNCDDIWSNLAGVVRVEFDDRVKEILLPLARFLGAIGAGSANGFGK